MLLLATPLVSGSTSRSVLRLACSLQYLVWEMQSRALGHQALNSEPVPLLLQQNRRQGLNVHPAQLAAFLKALEPFTTGYLPRFEVCGT